MPRMSLDEVEKLAFEALRLSGASERAATCVARAVRRAEADGLPSIGLGFLPTFLKHLRSGRVLGTAEPTISRPAPGLIQVDAGDGFFHPAFDVALPELAAATKAQGIAAMIVHRSYSAGVLGHCVEDLAMAGLVALGVTNGPANIAPWGGHKPLFGTNPLAFAVPREGAPPMILDQASSAVARVTLNAALGSGLPLPQGWALGGDGRPTTDPAEARQGSLAPAGGAKGAGIALMVEVLAAVFTGANLSARMQGYGVEAGPPLDVGQLFIALDPGFAPVGFADRLETLFGSIDAQEGARLPGDRRLAHRAIAASEGVEVAAALVDDILAWGKPS